MALYKNVRCAPEAGHAGRERVGERGAAVVEWLGISALSVGLLVVIFQGMESLGVELVDSIRSQLGL